MERDTKTVFVFDVDGTLTASRNVIEPVMARFLEDLKTQVKVALVGGSDLVKIAEQMGGDHVIHMFDYVFAENGLVAYKDGQQIGQQNILKHMGEEILQKVINFSLHYMSQLKLPAKRGTFIEFRSSMINICPVGRSCSQAERNEFAAYDQEHQVREKFKGALEKEFQGAGLQFAIGGQISIDVFPEGWNKTYCLRFMENDVDNIHFFGDKTEKGGNDHEIYADPRTVGHSVTSPEDTRKQVTEVLNSLKH